MKQGTARPLSGKGSRTKSTFESKEVYDERMEALKVSKRVLKVTSLPVQPEEVKKPASAPSSSASPFPTAAVASATASMDVDSEAEAPVHPLENTVTLSHAVPVSTVSMSSSATSMVAENTVHVQPPQVLKTVALPAPSSFSSAARFSTAVSSSLVPVSRVAKPFFPDHLRDETWNMPLHKQAQYVSLFAFMSFTFFFKLND
jgi:hypothetical protein